MNDVRCNMRYEYLEIEILDGAKGVDWKDDKKMKDEMGAGGKRVRGRLS